LYLYTREYGDLEFNYFFELSLKKLEEKDEENFFLDPKIEGVYILNRINR